MQDGTSNNYIHTGETAPSTQKDLPATAGSLRGNRGEIQTSPNSQVADLGLVVTWDRGNRVSVRLRPQWANRVRKLIGETIFIISGDWIVWEL